MEESAAKATLRGSKGPSATGVVVVWLQDKLSFDRWDSRDELGQQVGDHQCRPLEGSPGC